MTEPTITAIAALTEENRGIGKNGEIPWMKELSSKDLQRFKRLTSGHPIIMGRTTWDSLPFKPLPDRVNIVLTRNEDFEAEGAVVSHSLRAGLAEAREVESEQIFIIGGAEAYKQALPLVDRLELTFIHKEYDCDTFFPPFRDDFEVVAREEHRDENPPFSFCTFERV